MYGIIHSTESFGASDGPGIRYIVFMQGCNMRCKYCHNPDSWACEGEKKTPEQVLENALRYRDYWGENGGITVSGGEPMLQAEFVTQLFTLAKEQGIHTALDTSGEPFDNSERFQKLFSVTDLVLLDIKHIDSQKHKELTGRDNTNILSLARYLCDKNIPVWIRHVLVPGLETNEDIMNLRDFIKSLKNVQRVDVLPYHTLGVHKWENLGINYPLKDTKTPTPEYVEQIKNILKV